MKHREHDEQVKFFNYMDVLANTGVAEAEVPFAVPNGARVISVRYARRLVDEGMKKGVPDIICWIARSGFNGLAIEMKIPPNKSTKDQLKWQKRMRKYNWKVVECHSGDEALRVFVEYVQLTESQYRPLQEVIEG